MVVNKAVPNVDLSAWGSPFTTRLVYDQVFEELDANGNVVWSWNTLQHIPVTETNAQWRGATAVCFGGTCQDIYHWNSIEPITESNGHPGFVISFRHTDAVYNIDQTTGSVVWRLGGLARRTTSPDGIVTNTSTSVSAADGAFSADDIGVTITDSLGLIPVGTKITAVSSPNTATISQAATGTGTTDVLTINPDSLTVLDDPVFSGGSHFGGQHDPRVRSDGTVTVHDDGSDLNRPPRGVRYRIDAAAMTATLVEQVSDPSLAGSSFCCGSARNLPGGDWVFGLGRDELRQRDDAHRCSCLRAPHHQWPLRVPGIPVPFGQLDRATLRAAMDQNASLAASAAVAPEPPPPLGYRCPSRAGFRTRLG